MNKRIKELAKHAGVPSLWTVGTDQKGNKILEKFAELIVEEACRVLEAGKPGVYQVPAEIALHMMQKNLRAYFGVSN